MSGERHYRDRRGIGRPAISIALIFCLQIRSEGKKEDLPFNLREVFFLRKSGCSTDILGSAAKAILGKSINMSNRRNKSPSIF